jgi:hypothetical protein
LFRYALAAAKDDAMLGGMLGDELGGGLYKVANPVDPELETAWFGDSTLD